MQDIRSSTEKEGGGVKRREDDWSAWLQFLSQWKLHSGLRLPPASHQGCSRPSNNLAKLNRIPWSDSMVTPHAYLKPLPCHLWNSSWHHSQKCTNDSWLLLPKIQLRWHCDGKMKRAQKKHVQKANVTVCCSQFFQDRTISHYYSIQYTIIYFQHSFSLHFKVAKKVQSNPPDLKSTCLLLTAHSYHR